MEVICNFEEIPERIIKENLETVVVSYGGSGTNALVDTLELNQIKCRTPIWMDLLCHAPIPFSSSVPIIYLYRNPIDAFLSMVARGDGIWDVNQRKLSNNQNSELSDENLFRLMIKQYYSWSEMTTDNILFVKYIELFEKPILPKLEGFLKRRLEHFPIENQTPKENSHLVTIEMMLLFDKYANDIIHIDS